MVFDPQNNSSSAGKLEGNDGFQIGQDKQFGKSDASIGMSSEFAGKLGGGRGSLNPLYARARERMNARLANTKENSTISADKTRKVEGGILEHAPSVTVNSAVRKIVKTMDENKGFDKFLAKGDQTLENKIKVAKSLINEIEGKDVGWNSYVHRAKANDTARKVLNKGVGGIKGLKVRDNYTGMQAGKAIAGTIGELTRDKEIARRARRT